MRLLDELLLRRGVLEGSSLRVVPVAFTDARRACAAWRVSSLAASLAFGAPLRGLTGLQPIPPRAFSAALSWL